ncbi:MAG TPA: condensation domain-containing protein [Actinophytocola sp.]|uniref:condensation domain-containing protein n=1 Tax=Actinophytocola sp. TaxID=1872138 RepID=UPI002DBC5778|nr:condensation domain-containing protein [Actinophytocola sp.]HEU5474364.1 condensation domain-containing protein [Actinophytocola sp.]
MRVLPMTPGQAVYHDFIVAPTTCGPAKRLFAAYVVAAELSLDRLAAAADRVVALHDSLRTAIEPVDGEPAQVIREPDELDEQVLRVVPWDGTPQDAARHVGALDDWWAVPRQLAVQVLAGVAGGATLVVCVLNHVCSDGISAELVFDQLRTGYDGGTIEPADVEQFAGYYAAMLDEGLRDTFDDWVRLLDAGSPALPQWMIDEKLATGKVSIGSHGWTLAPETGRALAAVAQDRMCTQFEVLAACAGLYFRRADGRPANIGIIHSGRRRFRGFAVQGLLRSYVVDLVDHSETPTVIDAVDRRRDLLRYRTEHFAKLPFEEVCARTGRSPGWRAGQLGAWEIELNGMYAAAPDMTMQQAPVRVADVPLAEDTTCENGGPTLLVSFVLGQDGIDASLRYVSPPLDAATVECIAMDLEATVRFVHEHPHAPISEAPVIH